MVSQQVVSVSQRMFAMAGVAVIGTAAVVSAPMVQSQTTAAISPAVELASAALAPDLDLLGDTASVLQHATIGGDDVALLDPTSAASAVAAAIGDVGTDAYPADGIGDVLFWPFRFVEQVVQFVFQVATWPIRLVINVVDEIFNVPFTVINGVFGDGDGWYDAAAIAAPDAAALPDLSDFTAELGSVLSNLAF